MKKIIVFLLVLLTTTLYSQSNIEVDLSAEVGFTGVLKHVIQSGSSSNKGDLFNYKLRETRISYYRFPDFKQIFLFSRGITWYSCTNL